MQIEDDTPTAFANRVVRLIQRRDGPMPPAKKFLKDVDPVAR